MAKTELIHPSRPGKALSQAELAIAEWIDWWWHRRLDGEIRHARPVEYETTSFRQSAKPQGPTTI
ncbi:IS3 family transposase [Streptomyces sp. NTH33]|uniref:IS3 family transposase n=1 Tax=Streptomyces sp. NTH33 TaxID=1735453 RepID=UPI000DAABB9D